MERVAYLIILALLSSLQTASASDDVKRLRLNLPAGAHESIRHVAREFQWEVDKQTGGKVKIEMEEVSPYSDNEILPLVSAGKIDAGGTTLDQFASAAPLAGIFLQPFMFNFNALIRAAAKPGSEIRKLIDANVLERTGTRVLWWQPNGSNVIFSKGVPSDGASVASLPVGTPDDQSKALITACGGIARPMATAELGKAFEDGQIKAAATDLLGVTTNNLWDAADTIMNTQHTPSLYILVINDKVWQGLSPEHQSVITTVATDVQERTWDRYVATEAVTYSLAEQRGMEVYELSPNEFSDWRACSSPLLEAYMERAGASGQKLFIAYGRLRTDPCCQEAPGAASAER
jgi:C4-dicarboxylate-binding protein DctP